MNIYLVRHGQSIANVDKSIHFTMPDHAIPLSEKGEFQVSAAATFLQWHVQDVQDLGAPEWEPPVNLRIWVSPYKRTRQTAARILEKVSKVPGLKVDVRENVMLCEQQFGLFDGTPDEETQRKFPVEYAHYALAEKHDGKFWARMPMGESRFDVAVRVHQAFGSIQRDHQHEPPHRIDNVIVVCHGVAMRAFIMQWLHLPYEWFEQEP